MHAKSPRWLEDIVRSGAFIEKVTADATFADFDSDLLLRSAVERHFEIIGEALRRLEATDPATAARISGHRTAIDFRNRLAHRYDDIDNAQVWEIIRGTLPNLLAETEQLLLEAEIGVIDET
jgi:uncharacterized protein with HEPN domain